jgi:hypothetical protein
MIIKLNECFANAIRNTRSESIDSIGSTISVDAISKTSANVSNPQIETSIQHSAIREVDQLAQKSLDSIIILDSPSNSKVKSLLDTYNGHLIDLGTHLLESLCDAAPTQLAARVGDFNENLFYEMQGHNKDLASIISDNQSYALNQQLKEDLQSFESSLRQSLNHDDLIYRGSFMRTEQTIYQPAHVDYDYPLLQEHGHKLFLAFFPLTKEGTYLQLWNRDEADYATSPTVHGTVVYIPYGKMLIVPADTIHGGGFRRGDTGNLRFHLYIELQDEALNEENKEADLLIHPMNKYTEEHDRGLELCERFVDAQGLDHLLGVFFDD